MRAAGLAEKIESNFSFLMEKIFIFNFSILGIFILDSLLGEPSFIVHPVVIMGKLISFLEKALRKIFNCPIGSSRKYRERTAGTILVLIVCTLSFGIPFFILKLLSTLHFPLSQVCSANLAIFHFPLSSLLSLWWGYQCLAARCLRDEAMNVYRKLSVSLEEGRNAVGRIVGRETKNLSEEGVIKACVETVAENTTDGIFSPLFFFAIGGAPLGLLYKAINTMDSMLGYKNERYRYFGTAAARLDDIANFIPARIAAFCMILSSFFMKNASFRRAFRIFFRDRYKHESPNSAQTESVMAGILGIQLNGDAVYEGKIEHKPSLGDSLRPIERDDIKKAVKIMYISTLIFLSAIVGISFLI